MGEIGTIVVIGAGQAGYWATRTLRDKGFEGRVVLIGEETHPPYERPPLSKAVLAGSESIESTYFATEEKLAEVGIELLKNRTVTSIDRDNRTVTLNSGDTVAYDRLMIATGTRVRTLQLPGSNEAPIHYLRDIDECLALQRELTEGRRLVVIGGGLIGLEIAATSRELGCEVTVLEYADRLMARVVGPEISDHFAQLHAGHGVAVHTGVRLDRFETDENGSRVICADGTAHPADIIVVGIGAIPNSELAEAAGLHVENGIKVDEYGRTSDDRIFAAGDVTNHFSPWLNRTLRMETWKNAQDQGAAVARVMLGDETPYSENPWGWSNQFGVNLQFLGLPGSWDGGIVRGDPDSGSFSVFYMDGTKLAGVIAVSAAKDVAVSRRLMSNAMDVDPAQLADPDVSLRDLLR